MGIEIKDVEITEVAVKAVEIQGVYVKDVEVWPTSVSGAVVTSAVDDAGRVNGNLGGTYTNVPQLSSDGSGTGAKFDITVTYVSNKNLSAVTAQSVNLNNQGTGYAVGEIITLDMSGATGPNANWNPKPAIEVLTVTT